MLKNSTQTVNTEREQTVSNTNTQFLLLCITPLYFSYRYSISYNKDLAMTNRFNDFNSNIRIGSHSIVTCNDLDKSLVIEKINSAFVTGYL